MGTLFMVFPLPKNLDLKNYQISLRFLASAYFLLAILNTILLFDDFVYNKPEYFNFTWLLLSSLQALLFTYTLIILFDTQFAIRKHIKRNLLPILIFFSAYIVSVLFSGDCVMSEIGNFEQCIRNPAFIIRLMFFIFYLFQLIFYTYIFLKEEALYVKKINEYFSDTTKLRLKWIRYAFFSALLIGLSALFYQVFPSKTYNILFTFSLIVFYFVFSIKYINYNKLFAIIQPVVSDAEIKQNLKIEYNRSKSLWKGYKSTIISEKIYLREGITLDETAQLLKIGRTTLSGLINSEENVNFNTWINQLRIEEAKILFSENPVFPIIKVAEMTGFSEHSNFSRQFKLITGESPSVWRKKMQHNFVVLQ
jgi:AraC-like DNA-binding protein